MLKISSRWHFTCTPISFPKVSKSADNWSNESMWVVSTIIIMLKYSCTMVCEMSNTLICLLAK